MRFEFASNLVLGGLGGLTGTSAMTSVMRRLHGELPDRARYPLPPREIVEEAFPVPSDAVLRSLTTLSHYGYGALAGALFGLVMPKRGVTAGMAYGLAVWLASYLGWIPVARLLKPATLHPAERNLLMILAHLVWGAVTAMTMQELRAAERTVFAGGFGANRDASRRGRKPGKRRRA